jgi:uncharacterized protein
MAAFLDQAGAPFSVWQAGTMPGTQVFDVPGALTWNELTTRDVDGSIAFYHAVFGWTARNISTGEAPYLVWDHDGRTVAGMQPMVGANWPDDLAPHWMVYFAVADCDATAEQAHALGGRVVHPPTTFARGRYAVLEDPQGGTFSVLTGTTSGP